MQDLRLRCSISCWFLSFLISLTLSSNPLYGQSITIVLDAGHGGKDIGTHGKSILEKDATLKLTMELGRQLQSSDPSIHVTYTRNADVFIPLHRRVDIANANNADLFISIHCNSVDSKHPHGIESYVLGLSDSEENLEIAKRENSSILHENDISIHYEGLDPYSPEGHVFLSTIQNEYLDHSIDLAHSIQSTFDKKEILFNRGVKQGGFVVLRKATMPAILIEAGFLTNSSDEVKLCNSSARSQIVESICQGILKHVSRIKRSRSLANETLKANSQLSNAPSENNLSNTQIKRANDATTQVSVRFRILIASSAKGPLDLERNISEFNLQVEEHYDDGLYKYHVGKFESLQDALLCQNELRSSGFKGAYVVREDYPSEASTVNMHGASLR